MKGSQGKSEKQNLDIEAEAETREGAAYRLALHDLLTSLSYTTQGSLHPQWTGPLYINNFQENAPQACQQVNLMESIPHLIVHLPRYD